MARIMHVQDFVDSPLRRWECNVCIDGDVTLVQAYNDEVD